MKRLRAQVTYANVVSTLCLFLLLGGGAAVAATQLGKNSVGTAQLKKGAVTGAKIKDATIAGSKLKAGTLTGAQIDAASLGEVPRAANALNAKQATHADTATSADKAGHAETAGFAEAAAPMAFAFVEENGTLVAARSRGVSSVSRPSKGVYCVTVANFVPTGGQVTPEFLGFPAQAATLTIGGTGFCPAPAVQVITSGVAAGGTTYEDQPFQIALYR